MLAPSRAPEILQTVDLALLSSLPRLCHAAAQGSGKLLQQCGYPHSVEHVQALFGNLTLDVIVLTMLYSTAGLGIAIVNDFKSIEGDRLALRLYVCGSCCRVSHKRYDRYYARCSARSC